jgi:molybdopterin biosynthesis enzyme
VSSVSSRSCTGSRSAGSPAVVRRVRGEQLVFGLPGNPVSALVCLVRYVVPALAAAIGARGGPGARAARGAFHVKPALWYFLPVRLQHDATAGCVAVPKRRAAQVISCHCSAPTVSSSCHPARRNTPRAGRSRSIVGDL